MRRVLLLLVLGLVGLGAVLLVRGSNLASRQIEVEPADLAEVDADAAADPERQRPHSPMGGHGRLHLRRGPAAGAETCPIRCATG